MNTPANQPVTPDEKLMAAIAHFFGPLAGIIVWVLQREKSRFVKFQALQALSFDFVVMIVMGLLFFCGFGVVFFGIFGSLLTAMDQDSFESAMGLTFLIPIIFPFATFACVLPSSFLLLIIRLIAATSVLNGRDYRYPVIGKWLDNFLNEDRQARDDQGVT
jgi:uncharacterized Tic20 family protein